MKALVHRDRQAERALGRLLDLAEAQSHHPAVPAPPANAILLGAETRRRTRSTNDC